MVCVCVCVIAKRPWQRASVDRTRPARTEAVMARITENARFGSLDDEVPKNGGHALRSLPEGERSLPRGAESTNAVGALIWEWHAASGEAASHQGGHGLPRTAAATAGRPRSPSPAAEHAARRCAAPYVRPDCAAPSAAPSARGAPAAPAAGSQQAATPTAAPASSEQSLGEAWAAAHVAIGDGGEAAAGRRSTKVLGPRTLSLAPERYQLFRRWAPASGNCAQRACAAAQGGLAAARSAAVRRREAPTGALRRSRWWWATSALSHGVLRRGVPGAGGAARESAHPALPHHAAPPPRDQCELWYRQGRDPDRAVLHGGGSGGVAATPPAGCGHETAPAAARIALRLR